MALYTDTNAMLPEVELPSILPEQVEYFTPEINSPVPEGELEEDYNAFERGLYSGFEQTQGMLYGGAAALADIAERHVGWAPFQDLANEIKLWGYEGYKRNQDEAAAYGEMTSFDDAFDTPENFFTYVAETIGGLAPTVAMSLVSGGIGGAVAKTLSTTAGKRALKAEIASLVASGVTEKAAAEQALRSIVQGEARKAVARGAMAGTVAASSIAETGGNWGEDVDAHGIENTQPGMDILFGTMSGLTELVGGEGRLIRTILGKPASEATEEIVQRSLGKVLAERAIKDPLGEGLQEAAQEFLSIANANIQDERELITPKDAMRLVEAGFGGIIGGVGFGGVGAAYDARQIYNERVAQKRLQDENEQRSVKAAEEKARAAEEIALQVEEQNITKANEQFQVSTLPLVTEMANLDGVINRARQSGDNQSITEATNRKIEIAAQIAKFKDATTTQIKEARKASKDIQAKSGKEIIQAVNNEVEYAADPFKRMQADAKKFKPLSRQQKAVVDAGLQQATDTVQQYSAAVAAQDKELLKHINDLQNVRADSLIRKSPEITANINKTLDKLIKQRAQLVKKAQEVRKLGDKVADSYVKYNTAEQYEIPESWQSLRVAVQDSFRDSTLEEEVRRTKRGIRNIFRDERKIDANVKAKGKEFATSEERKQAELDELNRLFKLEEDFPFVDVAMPLAERTMPALVEPTDTLTQLQRVQRRDTARTGMAQQLADIQARRARVPAAVQAEEVRATQAQRVPFREQLARVRTGQQLAEVSPLVDVMELEEGVAPAPISTMDTQRMLEAERARAEQAAFNQAYAEYQKEGAPFTAEATRKREAAKRQVARKEQAAKRKVATKAAEEKAKQVAYDIQAKEKAERGKAQAAEVKRQQVLDRPFTDNPYERTSMAIRNTLERLPVLKGITQVVENANDSRVPKHVQIAASTRQLSGAFDPKTGKIYIFANKIKSNKQAIRVLLHEGVGHFGLSQIMNEEERKAFLDAVVNGNIKDPKFQQIAKKYSDLSSMEKAEEYFASLAEQARVSDIKEATDKNKATVWRRLKGIVKKFVTRVGLVASKKEVNDVITASIHFLANKENIGKIKKITGPQEIMRVRGSRPYLSWKSRIAKGIKEVNKAWREYKTGVNTAGQLRKINVADKLIMAMQDKELRVKQVQDYLSAKLGKALPIAQNVYINMENFVNRNSSAIRSFREEHVFGPNGVATFIEKAVNDSRTKEQVLAQADELAIAMHAIERNEAVRRQYKGSLRPQEAAGMSDAEARKIIAKYAGDGDILAIVNKTQEIGRLQLKTMEQHNLISPKLAEELRSTYNYYVPLKGLDETIEKFDPDYRMKPTGTSFSATKKPVAVAKGRQSMAETPVAHMINQMEGTLTMIEKNSVGRSLLELVTQNPDESLWVTDRGNLADAKQYKTRAIRDKEGNLSLRFVPKAMPLEGEQGVVTVIDENGNPVQIKLMDEQFYKAVVGTNVFQTGDLQGFLGGIGKINRAMAVANTILAPAFVAVNIVRDSINTVFTLPAVKAQLRDYNVNINDLNSRVFKDVVESFKALRKDASLGKNANPEFLKLLDEYKKHGGYTEYLNIRNIEQMQKRLGGELVKERDGFIGMTAKKAAALYGYAESYSSVFENMFRFSLFKNASAELMKAGMTENDAYTLASNMALNLNVNFTKRGTYSPLFSPLFMFANASIQGTARLGKTLAQMDKRDLTKFGGTLMLAPIAMGMMGRALGGEDDDGVPYYDKIPNYVRNNNIIFMMPGGKYIKVPVPYGLNILTTVGNMMFDTQNEANPTSVAKGAMEVVMASFNNFNPMGSAEEGFGMFVPTPFRPLYQAATNTNYLGNPIRPENAFIAKAELPDSQKYWSTTNGFLKEIAQGLNRLTGGTEATAGLVDVSPATLQHLFASYTGSLGQMIANTAKTASRAATLDFDSITLHEFPVIRRFADSSNNYRANAAIYYDLRQQILNDKAEYDSVKSATGLSSTERLRELKRLRKGAIMDAVLGATDKQLKAIRKLERALEARSTLEGSALAQRLDLLKQRKERAMKRLIKVSKLRGYNR